MCACVLMLREGNFVFVNVFVSLFSILINEMVFEIANCCLFDPAKVLLRCAVANVNESELCTRAQ